MQTMLLRSRVYYRLLSVLLLSLTCFYSNAQASEHLVTINGEGITLKTVFKAIKKQTGFAVMYNTTITMLNQEEKVTVSFKDTPLDEVLSYLFKGRNLGWTYNDDVVVIHKKEVLPKKNEGDSTVTPAMLTGKITDAAGSPLPGVTVQVKGGSQGTTTDADGKFALAKVRNGEVLVISSVGFEKREVAVKGRSVLAQLNMQVSGLDETVVIAYGTTTKRYSTGNIASVKAKDIANQPVSNPLLALQGRVPGLFIEQATGLPGSGVKVRIQGQNSLSRGSDPLYVIDGVPYVSQMLLGISNILGVDGGVGGGTGSPLSYINPADIESIDVLKDADATSIYGSRAAAGAILITTKKGKAGKTKIDLNLRHGWSRVGKFLDLLNTPQYLEMRHEAKRNDNTTINPTDYDINGTWDTTRYTDWQKKLIGNTAQYTDAQLSVSGGTATTVFLVSGGYHRETTVFPGNLQDQKISTHINLTHTTPNQRFKLQIDGQYMVDNNQLISTDLTDNAIRLVPNAPSLYHPDGSLNWALNASGTSTWNNPLAHLLTTYRNQVNNLIGNAVVSYELLSGLEIKGNLGYTNLARNEIQLFPLSFYEPEIRPFASRASRFGNDLITSWILEPQITYKKSINKGILEILVGTTFLKTKSNQQKFTATGFGSDQLLENVAAASTITSDVNSAEYKYNAVFARLNYNWQNKYIINFTTRRDGSSRFGSKNLFHNFGSVAGAWLFSNEGFIQKHLSFLSFGKLRASYGSTGNDQIGDYQFMNLYSPRSRTVPYQNATGLHTADYPNPYLQWEETRKLQLGLEAGFWSDRILLNFTYYRNRSSNQLQLYSLPLFTGSYGITTNFPATIQNSGWELTLNSINIQSKSIRWSSSINLTISKNKLLAYENLDQSSYANFYIIGKPFTIYHLYHTLGVDPATGLFIFSDSKANSTSNPIYPEDAIILLNTAPQYYGGLQNSISYKGLLFDFVLQFVKQKALGYKFGNYPGRFSRGIGNQSVEILDRWQKPGDLRSFQRFSTNYPFDVESPYSYALQSNGAWRGASFIRLKNLSLSWQLPQSMLQKVRLQNARLFIQGQNLLTFTNYTGLDPESKSVNTLPPLRVLTLGVQVAL